MNLSKISQRELKWRLRCLSIVVFSILVCLTCCIGGKVGKGPIPGDVEESKLRNIEGLDLKKMSKIPAESPEEVRESIREEETSNKESAAVPPLKDPIYSRYFHPTRLLFIDALSICTPQAGPDRINQAFHFLLSTMIGRISGADRLPAAAKVKMVNVNNRFLDDLVVFTSAGLAATLNSES
jgi:hypothetical protein